VYWADADGEARRNDPTGEIGFLTYAEVVDRYAERTDRDVSGIDYYVAFSSWRLAVISEGVYARYLHGAMGDQHDPEALDQFRQGTEDLAAQALDAVRRLT
jgi:aminoglycoside phosphotransferase (APT) family kinase protein